jgi:hypothetical protein
MIKLSASEGRTTLVSTQVEAAADRMGAASYQDSAVDQ